MVTPGKLPRLPAHQVTGYRLVNSKFPPISLFDDVANANEFEDLYAIQALTNPRLQNEVDNLALLPKQEIPFGIPGCAYATAPFTHVNPDGSRFSDGAFGVLYLADTLKTAVEEVKHHQHAYWCQVPELHYERFTFRGLTGQFDEKEVLDGLILPQDHPLYAATDYSAAQALGKAMRNQGNVGIRYYSVRRKGAVCWGLTTPRNVHSIIQTVHYEMIWNGAFTEVNQLVAR